MIFLYRRADAAPRHFFLFMISLLSINNKLLSRTVWSVLADRTVHPYASVRPRDYIARFNRPKQKSRKGKKKEGKGGKDKNHGSDVKERRMRVDLILLYLREL